MSEAIHRMEPEEFLEWCQHQEERHELVSGVPVAMAGAQRRHDQIVVNAMPTMVKARQPVIKVLSAGLNPPPPPVGELLEPHQLPARVQQAQLGIGGEPGNRTTGIG